MFLVSFAYGLGVDPDRNGFSLVPLVRLQATKATDPLCPPDFLSRPGALSRAIITLDRFCHITGGP